MSATANIEIGHGPVANTVWTSIAGTKLRFRLADDDILDLNFPLMVLNVSTLINGQMSLNTLSYTKTFRINIAQGATEELSNLRFFRSSAGNTGINELYGFTGTYVEAVGNDEGGNISGAASAVAVISMTTVPVLVVEGAGPFVGTGVFGQMIVAQWQITPAVSSLGLVSQEVVYTFRYDEI